MVAIRPASSRDRNDLDDRAVAEQSSNPMEDIAEPAISFGPGTRPRCRSGRRVGTSDGESHEKDSHRRRLQGWQRLPAHDDRWYDSKGWLLCRELRQVYRQLRHHHDFAGPSHRAGTNPGSHPVHGLAHRSLGRVRTVVVPNDFPGPTTGGGGQTPVVTGIDSSLHVTYRSRYMMCRSTSPSTGCRNARGTVPMVSNPSAYQSWIAPWLLATTALNCMPR